MPENTRLTSESEFDPSTDSIDGLIERYWPLVLSVCRAQLADAHEAEDVAQETFIKLMNHRGTVTGNVAAWLTRVARTTSIDRMRKAIRQRQRHERHAQQPAPQASAQHRAAQHAVRDLLPAALLELDPTEAEILTLRFIEQRPLRTLALRFDVSVPTMSRRVAQAADNLAVVLEDMGVMGAGELDLPLYLIELTAVNNQPDAPVSEWAKGYHQDFGLRYHVSRPQPLEHSNLTTGRPPFPGWHRPMRVGMLLSYSNHVWFNPININASVDFQANPAVRVNHPGVELVTLVEPRTNEYGIIESTVRDFELHDGLMEVTDTAALSTLDVIIVGHNFVFEPRFFRPILDAVRGGVGLYHEGHACRRPGDGEHPDAHTFMLARPPINHFCNTREKDESKHNLPVPGTVVNPHPALPWLDRGQSLTLLSCGVVFHPAPGTTTIAIRDQPMQGDPWRNPQLPPCYPPAVIAGQIGDGRALMNHMCWATPIFGEGEEASRRFLQTLAWLGEPRREALDYHR